jgi:hypothetical protein
MMTALDYATDHHVYWVGLSNFVFFVQVYDVDMRNGALPKTVGDTGLNPDEIAHKALQPKVKQLKTIILMEASLF